MARKKSKHLTRVLELMDNLERVRNCSLIGHVDHGKTTLSDSLLASSGLLNPQLAGEAHLLDFLDEEQERGITMKSANISLVFERLDGKLLLNLIDTPGHVDFSGKVTRALRLIDSAIVIVDAVEGVMIQTEHVVRQALDNAVRPLLFINKIDRLIKELELNAKEIQERFKIIIGEFNKLIVNYAKAEFMKNWMVELSEDTVAFGSALHGWGATLSQYLEKQESFNHVMQVYDDAGDNRTKLEILREEFPVHDAILKMLADNAPNPIDAQSYRIPFIWSGPMNSDLGKALKTCDENGPTMLFASKVQVEHGQTIATARIFSGSITQGDEFLLISAGEKEKANNIGIFMGQRILAIESVTSGNIVAIKGLKNIKSGESMINSGYNGDAKGSLQFEQLNYMMEPVVTVSIEPERLAELDNLQEFLEMKIIEDPNLKIEESSQTGEILLSGIGPLHLEVITKDIKKQGIPVYVSDPITMFHESIIQPSGRAKKPSTNGKNFVEMQIEPLNRKEIICLKNIVLLGDGHQISKRGKILLHDSGITWPDSQIENLIHVDDEFNAIILDARNDPQNSKISPADERLLVSSLRSILRHGPLVGESIRNLKINIKQMEFTQNPDDRDISEIIPMLRQVLFDLMKESGLVLMEPMFDSTIYGSVDNIGKLSSLISQYNGKIEEMVQDKSTVKIRATFPVRSSFDLIEDARTNTSGRAVFQNIFAGFQKISNNERDGIISELKEKKGLI